MLAASAAACCMPFDISLVTVLCSSTAAAVDVSVVTAAGFVARWFATRPGWLKVQRWFLGSAFGALAAWLALDRKTA